MVWDSLAEFRGTSKRAIRHLVSVRPSVPASFNPESPSHLHTQRSSQLFALSFPFETIQWYWFQTYECIIKRLI